MTFLKKKMAIYRPKFLTTFFKSSILFCLSLLSEILIYNIMHNPFLDQKPRFHNKQFLLDTFLSQLVVCLTSNNQTSQNIGGGRMHRSSPPQFFGARQSLRPCQGVSFYKTYGSIRLNDAYNPDFS